MPIRLSEKLHSRIEETGRGYLSTSLLEEILLEKKTIEKFVIKSEFFVLKDIAFFVPFFPTNFKLFLSSD